MTRYWHLVRRHPRPFRFLAARLLMATGGCRVFTIRQQGFRIRFHPANLSSQLWIEPRCREDALIFFREYLKPGDLVVDVGANIGDTVLTSARCVGPAGRVIGIEPHPRTFRFLRDNVALNHVTNVELLNVAAGARSSVATLSDDRRDDMNRIGDGGVEVRLSTLDELVGGHQRIALLKVDVEGYEKFVFEGASAVLDRTSGVHFEVSSTHLKRFGYAARELLTLVRRRGFGLFRPSGARRFVPITVDYDPDGFENLLAIRDVEDFVGRSGWAQLAGGV